MRQHYWSGNSFSLGKLEVRRLSHGSFKEVGFTDLLSPQAFIKFLLVWLALDRFLFFSTGRWVCISTEDVALSYLVLETGQSQAHSCFMLQHTLNCHSQTKISLQPLSSSLCVSAAQSWSVAERHIKHPPKTSSANVSQRTTAGHSSYKIYIQDKYTCSIMDMTSRSGCWTTVLVPVYKHRRRSSSTWTVYQSLPHSSL